MATFGMPRVTACDQSHTCRRLDYCEEFAVERLSIENISHISSDKRHVEKLWHPFSHENRGGKPHYRLSEGVLFTVTLCDHCVIVSHVCVVLSVDVQHCSVWCSTASCTHKISSAAHYAKRGEKTGSSGRRFLCCFQVYVNNV